MGKKPTKAPDTFHGVKITRDALHMPTNEFYRCMRIPSGQQLGPERWISYEDLVSPRELANFLIEGGFSFRNKDRTMMHTLACKGILNDLIDFMPKVLSFLESLPSSGEALLRK